jgi:hypothetical protein
MCQYSSMQVSWCWLELFLPVEWCLGTHHCFFFFSFSSLPSGKFAFAEFRSLEEANNGMNLLGIILMGRPLKIARSRDFNGKEITVTPWPVWMGQKIKENPALAGKVIGMPDPSQIAQMGNGMFFGDSKNTTVQDRAVRELYVGNTPGIVTESLLSNFINAACIQAKLCTTPAVTNVRMSERFCFVEFCSAGKIGGFLFFLLVVGPTERLSLTLFFTCLSSCPPVLLSSCPPVLLSSCPPVLLSSCPAVLFLLPR